MLKLIDLVPGKRVKMGMHTRIVKRVVWHPAGWIVQWVGRGDYAKTHNSFTYLQDTGAELVA